MDSTTLRYISNRVRGSNLSRLKRTATKDRTRGDEATDLKASTLLIDSISDSTCAGVSRYNLTRSTISASLRGSRRNHFHSGPRIEVADTAIMRVATITGQ